LNNLERYPDMLSVKHLTEIFGVSKQTIYKEMRDGKFGKPIFIGRSYKIPRIYIWEKFFENYK
jgi:predicted DNA-binding transcriptional regulator AlpA